MTIIEQIKWVNTPAELEELGLYDMCYYFTVDFEGIVRRLMYIEGIFKAANGKEYQFDDFTAFAESN